MTRRLAVVVLVALAQPAAADTSAAVEVDRDETPPGRVELGFDAGAAVDTWGASVDVGLLDRPIVLHGDTGESAAVSHRESVVLGGAVALGESFVFDARLALSHQVGDRLLVVGDATPLARWVLGDARFGGRIRLTDTRSFGAFVRAELTVPSGSDHDFAGEAKWTAAWSLIGRLTPSEGWIIGATAGIRLRGSEVMIADRLVGDELFGALGIVIPLPPVTPLWCQRGQVSVTAELAAVLGDNVAPASGPSPIEARVGIVTHPLPALSFGARVGFGLGDQIGAPRWRGLVELAWTPPGEPKPKSATAPPDDDPDD